MRERIRYLHYSLPTEQAYVHWVRAFIRFHGVRHPATLGGSEVRETVLSAGERAQGFGLHASSGIGGLAVLLRQGAVHGSAGFRRSEDLGPSRRLPVVLTPDEVVRILGFLEGEHRLFAQLLYGTGMRISEGLQLRVRIWISITARSSCGRARAQDRALMLPESLAPSLREQLSRARAWWLKDQAEGRSGVALPDALERSIRAPGILAVVLGFCAAHAFDRSTERCRASPSHV